MTATQVTQESRVNHDQQNVTGLSRLYSKRLSIYYLTSESYNFIEIRSVFLRSETNIFGTGRKTGRTEDGTEDATDKAKHNASGAAQAAETR